MDYRDLLERVAKVLGYVQVTPIYHSDDDGTPTDCFWYLHVVELYDGNTTDSCAWNPITSDSDALRLAVKRRVFQDHHPQFIRFFNEGLAEDKRPSEATRLAIVRTVANLEVG